MRCKKLFCRETVEAVLVDHKYIVLCNVTLAGIIMLANYTVQCDASRLHSMMQCLETVLFDMMLEDLMVNKKTFKKDVYCLLANRTCFSGHQISVLIGAPQVNASEQVSNDGHQMSRQVRVASDGWSQVRCPGEWGWGCHEWCQGVGLEGSHLQRIRAQPFGNASWVKVRSELHCPLLWTDRLTNGQTSMKTFLGGNKMLGDLQNALFNSYWKKKLKPSECIEH